MDATQYNYRDNLQSERLVTRFLTSDDGAAWDAFFQDKEAIALFPATWHLPGQSHGALWVERQLQRYRENKLGLQALIDKSSGAFIGQCGLLVQEVDGKPEIEVGYHIFKKYWGNGYAPEAARIFIDYAFDTGIAESVISIIDSRNVRSQRVAEKNGLTLDKETTWNGRKPTDNYALHVYIYRINKQ